MSVPTVKREYAFSGSLCRVCEFETLDALNCCLTIFSLADYKHLHFPCDEYKWLISELYTLQCMQEKLHSASNSDVLNIKQTPAGEDFKITFGNQCLTISPVTAFGLVQTSPFPDFLINHSDKNHFTCNSKWDICTCKNCSVYKRLIDYEAAAMMKFPLRKPENLILFPY